MSQPSFCKQWPEFYPGNARARVWNRQWCAEEQINLWTRLRERDGHCKYIHDQSLAFIESMNMLPDPLVFRTLAEYKKENCLCMITMTVGLARSRNCKNFWGLNPFGSCKGPTVSFVHLKSHNYTSHITSHCLRPSMSLNNEGACYHGDSYLVCLLYLISFWDCKWSTNQLKEMMVVSEERLEASN